MKYRNVSGSFKSFSIPRPTGTPVWVNAESKAIIDIPEDDGWRAEAFGFVRLDKLSIKPVEVIEPKIEQPKKHTEKELAKMTKPQQKKLLKSLGAKSIPALERDRVALILELQ